MEVRVKLFATLCQYSPGAKAGVPFTVDLPEGATLADLVEKLALPRSLVKVVFVNGLVRESDHQLQPADEVGLFPPIAGGAGSTTA